MKVTEVHPGYKAMTDDALTEHIRVRLGENPKWARRALLALYDEQTDAEKEDPTFHESNGMGFSPNDQEFLSSLAEQALRSETFSQKQLGWLYKLLPKYSKQIVKLVRAMEKLEKAMIPEIPFIKVTVDNSMRMIRGVTGELGWDPRSMPEAFVLRSPDNQIRHLYTLKEVFTREGIAYLFVYTTEYNNKEWVGNIEVGEPEDLPQWAKDMSKAMGMDT